MRYLLKSLILGFEFEREIDCLCETIDEISDYVQNELWDIYIDLLSSYQIEPIGLFDEAEVNSKICQNTEQKINANKGNWIIECSEIDDEESVIRSNSFEITGLLLNMLDMDSSYGEFCARISSYVESCLLEFVKQSKWHVEKDSLWFGPEGSIPLSVWSINSQTGDEDLSFWFEADTWTILNHIGDFSDSFLIWYTTECGCVAPDMDEIRGQCPIDIYEEDSVAKVIEKIKKFNNQAQG